MAAAPSIAEGASGAGTRQISQALHVRDMPRAQELIEDGAELFGHPVMAAAVAAQARQDELSAMDAMGAVEQPHHEPGLADRQRRNLEQFDDARELVDAWRGGLLCSATSFCRYALEHGAGKKGRQCAAVTTRR
jgi:hypothetical protein